MTERREEPGKFPFARGIHATMYRGKLWTMRQYAGFGTATETNKRYKYLLSQGQTGLSMAFDLPTQIGYDSDDKMALGEVGRVGVAISSLADMEQVFHGIPLDKVSTSMTIMRRHPYYGVVPGRRRQAGRAVVESLRHGPERYLKSTSRAAHTFSRPPVAAPHRRYRRVLREGSAGLEHDQASAAITCARPAAPPRRKSPSRSPMESRTCRPAWNAAWMSTASRRASRSSSTVTAFSRRDREIPRRAPALGAHHARPFRREERTVDDAAVSHADGGLDAHRAAAGQ